MQKQINKQSTPPQKKTPNKQWIPETINFHFLATATEKEPHQPCAVIIYWQSLSRIPLLSSEHISTPSNKINAH